MDREREPSEARVSVNLAQLTAALPEIYQPIYGHPELSVRVSRRCDDRLAYIEAVWRDLAQALGRPPRVLDLGCAQGYIGLRLAALGAPVHGIDHSEANIALCRALADEQPQSHLRFTAASLERLFETVDLREFDLVLGLSVVHHMSHRHGHEAVTQWLTIIGANVAACIFELALAEEPVSWAAAQPADERRFLRGFAFTRELARLPTHLSHITRPLIFASNYVWHLDGRIDHFTSVTRSSHDEKIKTAQGSRRYFMNERSIAKVYSLRDAFPVLNRSEIINEATFLAEPPPGFRPVPKILTYGINEREAWLVREALPGQLLFDHIRNDLAYDAKAVVDDVLTQLAVLEAAGLYHNDVTTWNVLIMPDGEATLIDFGSISAYSESFSWPHGLFSAFWIFVWCVATRSKWSGGTVAPPFASPHNLPEPFAAWAYAFARLPAESQSFAELARAFRSCDEVPAPVRTSEDCSRQHAERYLMAISENVGNLYDRYSLRSRA